MDKMNNLGLLLKTIPINYLKFTDVPRIDHYNHYKQLMRDGMFVEMKKPAVVFVGNKESYIFDGNQSTAAWNETGHKTRLCALVRNRKDFEILQKREEYRVLLSGKSFEEELSDLKRLNSMFPDDMLK